MIKLLILKSNIIYLNKIFYLFNFNYLFLSIISFSSRSKTLPTKKSRNNDAENEENIRSTRAAKKVDEPKAKSSREKIDPVLEARRRKFENNSLVGGSVNKKIRLKPLSENEANTVKPSVKSPVKAPSRVFAKEEKSVSTNEEKEDSNEERDNQKNIGVTKCDFSTQVTLEKDEPGGIEGKSEKTQVPKKEKVRSRRALKRKSSESEKEGIDDLFGLSVLSVCICGYNLINFSYSVFFQIYLAEKRKLLLIYAQLLYKFLKRNPKG